MAATPREIIQIDGESYSLVEIPPETSGIVKAAKEGLREVVDLKSLVDDLGRVGKFVRVAYNGVGAAGPRFTELQIKVLRLGYDITDLCDKSAVTVAMFRTASDSILINLQATYQYLLDNLEEMSVGTLSAVSKLAGRMVEAAEQLHKEFEEQAEKVRVTLEETMEAKGEQAQRVEEKRVEREKMEKEQQAQEQLMREAKEREQEVEAAYQRYEKFQDDVIQALGEDIGPIKRLMNGLTSMVGLGEVFADTSAKAKEKASHWKEKKCEALKKANEFREKRYEALQKFTDFAAKISKCQNEEKMANVATEALHEAIRGLKQLAAIMMQAVFFWKQIQKHCESLSGSEIQEEFERAWKLSDDKRLKVWTSRAFKRKAIQFYGGWVALHSVCTEYVEQIKLTRKDLYEYIKENPTYEESRELLPRLAQEFQHELKSAQKAIQDQTFAAQEEMKALSGPPP